LAFQIHLLKIDWNITLGRIQFAQTTQPLTQGIVLVEIIETGFDYFKKKLQTKRIVQKNEEYS
jgi:hypothetical protein